MSVNVSKIRELEAVLGSGARNNKYSVIFPYFGRELDIQTHDVTAPGRSIGIAEVYLKGRKYQLAGDRADEGSLTLTFYNDPEMLIRRFFLQVIAGIQNFDLPYTIENSVSERGGDLVSRVKGLGRQASIAFEEMKNNFRAVRDMLDFLNSNEKPRHIDFLNHYSQNGSGLYMQAPWYQTDIRIQQLDHDGIISTESIYHHAFVTDVSAIEYQDEVGEISTTTLTIAYTAVSYGTDSVDSMDLRRS